MTGSLGPLLLLYAGINILNLSLSLVLWRRGRTALHRTLVLVWASSALSSVIQALPAQKSILIVLAFASSYPICLALVDLIARVVDLRLRWRWYLSTFLLGLLVSTAMYFADGPFFAVALPVSIVLAVPLLHVPLLALRSRATELTTTGKAAAASCALYGLHLMDYPFLRDRPQLAPLGFALALLVIFAISITVPAVVLERVAQERTKIDELNRFQRNFFANITHELRTPLTMILAPLEGLLTEDFGPLTATQRSYLEANHRNALRLLKLINDLLDLAKMEEGFLRLRPEHSDLKQMLDEVVAYAKPLATRKNLTLQLVVKQAPSDLHVDVEKLERVVVNLISNALKFTSKGGVTVTLDTQGGEARIVVEDTGVGIPPEVMPRIFERFNQGDGSTTRKYGGTGIGLAYAKQIVELHSGSITVESTPGKGSRFVVHLPEGQGKIAEAVRDRRQTVSSSTGAPGQDGPELKRREDQEPREWAQRLQRMDQYRFAEIGDVTDRRLVSRGSGGAAAARILLVEDNLEILELVNLQLRDKYTIYAAQNGKAGLELARRERPDLIITDFMMPEMDGLTMLRELRSDDQFAETGIIMLTSKNHVDDRLAVRGAGADIYLSKPFSPRELETAVAGLLEKRGRRVNNLMRAHVEGLEIVSAGLAHEIQNPLNFIKGGHLLIGEQVAKIREQVAGAALTDPTRVASIDRAKQKIDKMIETSARGVSRIEGVVALLRKYAREGYPTEPTDVVLDDAVREVSELVAPPKDIECSVQHDLQAGEATVRAIPEELNQVIRSLVQNAMEAVGPGGKIQVKTRRDGKLLLLEVSDNGPGIAPDAVAKIFSPFFTTKPGTGRGLGLSIVQIVIGRAGGSVEVTSVQNVETIFRVRLPLSDGSVVDPAARIVAAPGAATAQA
jgi:signal transduction histidine kinase